MLLHESVHEGSVYQVRNAGYSLRLYRNGVLHSQWNPQHSLKGSLWELFLLAVVISGRHTMNTALVLGMGGGAVVNLFCKYLAFREIVALEQDSYQIELARQFFGVDHAGVRILHADAIHWLLQCGRRDLYDVIIDDLFMESLGQPLRGEGFTQRWYAAVLDRLTEDGMAVFNFADNQEWRRSGLIPALQRNSFDQILKLQHVNCQNVVICCYKNGFSKAEIRSRLALSSARGLLSFIDRGVYTLRTLSIRRLQT